MSFEKLEKSIGGLVNSVVENCDVYLEDSEKGLSVGVFCSIEEIGIESDGKKIALSDLVLRGLNWNIENAFDDDVLQFIESWEDTKRIIDEKVKQCKDKAER